VLIGSSFVRSGIDGRSVWASPGRLGAAGHQRRVTSDTLRRGSATLREPLVKRGEETAGG